MPVNTWNFYRAVSVGSDHKSWLSQNPQVVSMLRLRFIYLLCLYICYLTIKAKKLSLQVEDGRIGGNQEFESDVTDQYQYEVESISYN